MSYTQPVFIQYLFVRHFKSKVDITVTHAAGVVCVLFTWFGSTSVRCSTMADGLRSLVGSVIESRSRRGASTSVDCSGSEAEVPYCTVASVDSTAALLASVASDGSRAEPTSAAATMSGLHIVAGFDARSKSSTCLERKAADGTAHHMELATVNVRSECCQYCRSFDRTVPPAAPVLRGHRLLRLLQSRDIRLYAD